MRTIPVIVDSHLRLDGNLVGHDLANEIFDELTVPNPAYAVAVNRRQWNASQIPEDFLLGDLDGDTVVMARGYALQLKLLLREHGLGVRWIDRRTFRRGAPLGHEEFSYRAHQPAAVRAIRRHQQLIYKAPTGSGKTVTVCGAIWEMSPQWSIILVDRINLVDQWMDRIEEHVGIPRNEIGSIGDMSWSEGRITVATVQTLHRYIKQLREEDWFKQWSFVCLDECHHVTARTYLELVNAVSRAHPHGYQCHAGQDRGVRPGAQHAWRGCLRDDARGVAPARAAGHAQGGSRADARSSLPTGVTTRAPRRASARSQAANAPASTVIATTTASSERPSPSTAIAIRRSWKI